MKQVFTTTTAAALALTFAMPAVAQTGGTVAAGEEQDGFLNGHPNEDPYVGLLYSLRSYGGPEVDLSQSAWSLLIRGSAWRPDKRTLLRHMPGLDFEAVVGWVGEDDAKTREDEDVGAGGFQFGMKVAFPWTLIDGPLRVSAGFGGGWALEFGRSNPAGYDFDIFEMNLFGQLAGVFRLSQSLAVGGTYEYAMIGSNYESEHRLRGRLDLSALTVGLDLSLASLRHDMSFTELGLSAGFNFY